MWTVCLIFLVYLGECEPRATIEDNGYSDVVIAISPQLKEDKSLVNNIRQLFTEASEELYKATRQRAYFKRVKILLPKTWTSVIAEPSVDETFNSAEIIVDEPNSAYGDNPYTVQVGDCGEPGARTHFTPWFINHHNDAAAEIFGKTEKVVVHEWARLRYGVFEEYGYPGDAKFPMFYYKTTWTMNGQENVLMPNLCTDTDLNGISVDVMTGGACKESQDTGLPDNNCYYQPFLNNSVLSSYMSIPYLDSVVTFCDDTEDHIHNSDLSTKHNLYCDGKSVWNVIMENFDFQNGTNQPTDGHNTLPEFVVVRPQTAQYVLVMDTSLSMTIGGNPGKIPRDRNMLDAAKRWIKYEVADGTEVGLVVFQNEDASHSIMGKMMTVNEHSRDTLIMFLDDEVNFGGQTCIGCGLNIALTRPSTLNNSRGGVIILITDGKQQCRNPSSPSCLDITEVIDNLIEHQVRVVTVALGLNADPAIEDLALRTGGKSYYIDDSSGPGNINDAFTGSLTYQPGDVLENMDTNVYQRDWKDVTKKVMDSFDIDESIGRSTTFHLEVRTEVNDNNCAQDLNITLVDPSDNHNRTDMKFKCNATNFGVFKHSIPDLTLVGKWWYMVKPQENFASISVKVESKARSDSTEPLMTKCWISTGSQEVDTNVNVKLAVVAQVTQGNKPILGAAVEAQVERPAGEDGTPKQAMQLALLDNGSGADKIKNDGTYARYFAKYTGKGRYSVKCQVVGNEDTNVNGGFITAKHSRVYPEIHDPNNPLCCGSNALSPGANLTKTGNFTRHASGGSFQVTNDIDENVDNIPPGRVDDLIILGYNNVTVNVQFTSPGDDLDSNDEPANYTIKFSTTPGNITGENFVNTEFNTEIEENDLIDSSLSPKNGSTLIPIKIDIGIFNQSTKYYFAMTAMDHEGNTSPVSNLAQLYIKTTSPLLPTTTKTPLPTTTTKTPLPTTTTKTPLPTTSTTTPSRSSTTTPLLTTTSQSTNNSLTICAPLIIGLLFYLSNNIMV